MKLKIRTKNYSADGLKDVIETPVRAVFRLGSTTPTEAIFPKGVAKGRKIIEINTADACRNSGDKILMKELFEEHEIKTAPWSHLEDFINFEDVEEEKQFPMIIKHIHSSKGEGIYFIENQEQLDAFVDEHKDSLSKYIIEKYLSYSKEYRLHVTKDGCFYACRKMLKNDAEDRWHRHDVNSVWILEENPLFDRPTNWDDIVAECVKAMQAIGLDICSCDVKVQTSKGRKNDFVPEFVILETNSASSLGEVGLEKYKVQLKKMIDNYEG